MGAFKGKGGWSFLGLRLGMKGVGERVCLRDTEKCTCLAETTKANFNSADAKVSAYFP